MTNPPRVECCASQPSEWRSGLSAGKPLLWRGCSAVSAPSMNGSFWPGMSILPAEPPSCASETAHRKTSSTAFVDPGIGGNGFEAEMRLVSGEAGHRALPSTSVIMAMWRIRNSASAGLCHARRGVRAARIRGRTGAGGPPRCA